MKRKLLSLALSLATCLSLTVPALAGSPPTEEEAKTYFSLTRNGEDALTDKYLMDEEVTLAYDYTSGSWGEYCRVISADDAWEITNTGSGECTIWVSLNTFLLEDGTYIMDGHTSWRADENGDDGSFWDSAIIDGENGYYVLKIKSGESISFTTDDFIARTWLTTSEDDTRVILDQGEGLYVYELGVNMRFPGTGDEADDTSWATYTVCLMLDEDAVRNIENGNQPTEPTTPENPDTPEEYSPAIEVRDKILEGQTHIDLRIYVSGVTFNQEQSLDNWSISPDSGFTLDDVRYTRTSGGGVLLGLSGSAKPGEMTITAKPGAFESFYGIKDDVTCKVIIEKVEIVTFTPQVTATPATAAAGDTTIAVLLDTSNGTFSYGRLHDAMGAGVEHFFTVDTGTTGLVLTDVEAVQPDLTRAYYQAKLTFTANGGAQPGTLKITPLAFSFESNGNAQPTDANTVTVTVSGGSVSPTLPPVATPDIPYVPTTPGTSTGGSSTTTRPTTSTTTTPTTTTVTNPDGSTTTTMPDGTVTTTATDAAGNKTTTTENPNGSTVTTIENKDGGASTTTVSGSGQVTAAVIVPVAAVTAAQASSQAIALPMPKVPLTANAAAAPVVTVTTGSSQPVKVEIPVERTTPGTVAVIVNADGTEEVVKTSLTTTNGVTVTVANGATVKIVDNSKSFTDTVTHWAGNAITFATAHELFNGTGADSFTPDGTMTRGMMVTVLARYDGVDTTTGATWYEKGVDWAAANNISSGADLDAPVSREQLATMLYRYAAASGLNTAASGSLNGFADVGSVSDYAADAMAWAVGAGLIGGTDKGELNPGGSATRAEVATILMRFCENVVK